MRDNNRGRGIILYCQNKRHSLAHFISLFLLSLLLAACASTPDSEQQGSATPPSAFGKLTESEALNKLWDKLYDAGTMHRPYMDALHHFIDVMRDRGLVMYVQSLDGHSSRAFVPVEPASKPKDAAPAKPRKRERLARVGA